MTFLTELRRHQYVILHRRVNCKSISSDVRFPFLPSIVLTALQKRLALLNEHLDNSTVYS